MSIIEAIQKKRLQSLKASNSFTTARDDIVSARAEELKNSLKEISTGEKSTVSTASRLSTLYYSMLDEYFGTVSIRMPHKTTKKGKSLWERIAAKQVESGTDPEQFMRAQFKFFHKAFGKPPDYSNLLTDKAVERAIEHAKKEDSNFRVVGSVKHKVSFPELMRGAEKQMQDLCRAQGLTREEVYRRLVLTGMVHFPKEFLAVDPAYKKAAT